MKTRLTILIVILCTIIHAKSESFSHTFRFQETDFLIKPIAVDTSAIVSISSPTMHPKAHTPDIPIIGRRIALPTNAIVNNYSVSISKRLIRKNINLSSVISPSPAMALDQRKPILSEKYTQKIYPDSNCVFSKSYNIGEFNIASFLISPFIFDATKQELYFIDSIKIDIDLKYRGTRKAPSATNPQQLDLLLSTVDNAEIIESLPSSAESFLNDYYPYLIITNNTLKDAFKPLADWKRKKGCPSKIVTIEEIVQNYSGRTQQIKIKTCINDMHERYGVEYVLLGGDVDIIPAQMCYVDSKVDQGLGNNSTYAAYIPADVYYSCPEDLEWDTNNDDRAGDPQHDVINYIPILYVTRAPVRSVADATVFVNRTIEYEQSPKYIKTFLQAGATLDPFYVTGEDYADLLFDKVFNGKIVMGNTKLFDTYTYTGERFSKDFFVREFNSGYPLVEVIAHGDEKNWALYGGKPFFNVTDALSIQNEMHTLITTTSCLTNAFDLQETNTNPNPCLSEAFLRNPNSGVIGYLGSSRYGWFDRYPIGLTFSIAYEADFYERLLNPNSTPGVTNFGVLVTFVKHTFLSYMDDEPLYRWLHYSINAMGDPEMPIFRSYPKQNNSATAFYDQNGILIVDAGVDGAKICVSSAFGNKFYEISTKRNSTFNTGNGSFDVWITKQDYIPKHIKVDNYLILTKSNSNDIPETDIEPNILSITPNPTTNDATIKYSAHINSIIQISLTGINNNRSFTFDINDPTGEVTLDISNIPNDIYIVNIIEDGKLYTSNKRLIKK